MPSEPSCLTRFFRSFDLFGHPVELSYKGQSKYTTVIGGLSSIAIGMIIIAYFVDQLVIAFQTSPMIYTSNYNYDIVNGKLIFG